MKKLIVSFGLAAGAAGLASAFAQGMESASPKLWNASASLRGFYDDNYTVANNRRGSWGWEFSPSVSGHVDLQQTDFGIRYTFGMYYYVQRADEGLNPLDYSHQADLWFDHAFDETLKLNVTDSLVVSQDPALMQGGSVVRVEGNNVANHAAVTLSKEWTRQFSTATHYNNTLVVYSKDSNTNTFGANPSQAGLLNRIEQSVGNDFQWQFQPQTMGFIGYAYSWVRYTGNEQIAISTFTPGGKFVKYTSESRDDNAHYAYVGMEHVFTPNLSGTGKVGATFVDMYADPVSPSKSVAPYADISLTYTYIPGSYIQGGYRQDINTTSVSAPGSDYHLTQYQETSVFYFDITHQFDAKLTGTLVSQYIYSKFQQGAYNGEGENTVNLGLNLNYQISRHFSADLGYNFDELFSNVQSRGNTRNRVYFGLSASY